MKYTPEHIKELPPMFYFVFGSNLAGRHGKGAALTAKNNFGAKQGRGCGLMGRSYAIPTKDRQLKPLNKPEIFCHVMGFLWFASQNPQNKYVVTKIGCGLAGFKEKEIIPMFRNAPDNVILPKNWKT